MPWTKFFSNIYLLNLPERKDRLVASALELGCMGIEATVFPAIKCDNGQEGVYLSLMKIFRHAVDNLYSSVLIFEDDFERCTGVPDFNQTMEKAVRQLPEYWHMLFLGANLPVPELVTQYSANLLRTKRALGLHAVAYSHECMQMILCLPRQLPVDLQIANFIHPLGHSYVTYPLLCSQRVGYSDIEKRVTNYRVYLEDRYLTVLNHLNINPHERQNG